MELDRAAECLSLLVQRILDLIAEGRRSLSEPDASEWKALALTRWEMLRALGEFVSYKQTSILEPIAGLGCPELMVQANAIAARNIDLQRQYRDFVTHWALNSPIAQDAPYRSAALAMAAQIEARLIRDVQDIDALLLRTHTGQGKR